MKNTNNKERKERSLEQQQIYQFVQRMNQALQIRDFELGEGRYVLQFVRHDGYNYSVRLNSNLVLKFNIEIHEEKSEIEK